MIKELLGTSHCDPDDGHRGQEKAAQIRRNFQEVLLLMWCLETILGRARCWGGSGVRGCVTSLIEGHTGEQHLGHSVSLQSPSVRGLGEIRQGSWLSRECGL